MSQPLESQASFDLTRPANWRRVDETDDDQFYTDPRLVVHVDDYFIAALGEFYARHLPPNGVILDLMSSYKSHLPRTYRAAKVIGQGMNGVELQANDQLDEYIFQNLNLNPQLPFGDNTFDAVLNTVSVQYLMRPVEVFREVGRVLKPGGIYIASFSNRMFPTKAVQIWRTLDEPKRVALVRQYFAEAGNFEPSEVYTDVDERQTRGGWGAMFAHDPVYIVWAAKNPL